MIGRIRMIGAGGALVRLAARSGGGVAITQHDETREHETSGERLILFVCTGNTCRSPMAEAIARAMIERRTGHRAHIASAGTAAGLGMPATENARLAVESLGMPMHAHRSQPVTAELVRQARQVYVMTRSHLQVVRSLVMDAPVDPLDPDGDIADPIGGSEAVYAETARRLMALIEGRLDEIVIPLGKD